jgi:hypothetical protein
MQTYKMEFSGREKGAIGAWQRFNLSIEANTRDEAYTKLYDTHDHLAGLCIDGERVALKDLAYIE